MVTQVGSGEFIYEVLADWAKLPEGWSFVEVADVAVDSRGDLYVGEVSWSFKGSKMDPPRELRSFRKLVKLG